MKREEIVKKFTVDRAVFGVGVELTPQFVEDLTAETADDFLTGNLFLKLTSSIYAGTIYKDSQEVITYVRVPASWWQMFKRDILKIKKIKEKVVEIREKVNMKEYFTFPHQTVLPSWKQLDKAVYNRTFSGLGKLHSIDKDGNVIGA